MGIQIINGGFLTTVQDMGRYGYQETGMSVSGVMDTRAASLANILVGNDTNEAVIEITMMGPTMKFTEDEIIAVTRGYIAFSSYLEIPVVMGSRSTNLKSKVGGYEGRKLGTGDEIAFRAPASWLPHMAERVYGLPSYGAKEWTLRVVMGPQDDCFTDKGINTFLNSTYTISNEYDRMGCRMEGDVIEHKNGGDIITDGISFGAVQVPSHGNPIVMMADHQTTGGYTKIANVISVDLPVLAQCMPGMKIHFEKVTVDEAQALYCKEKEEFDALAKKLNTPVEPADDEQAVAIAAASEANKTAWVKAGTYKISVNGKEFLVELEKEVVRFR